ncbi:hypothetical protein ACH82I_08015 [Brevibacterium sp. GP-SGM9]|uniref:hypothetical protein n=1 Tax=unclassified Brevibacterium TaxID=2614124 RepID=UPI001E5E3510|nr:MULTISPECIES: hypothetical protein [unclassified Brevibacterium]MCD1287535.1 hypothetical protein [Brevibacterium sp. CCUG 69071]MDK8436657.1 hypothetical protein [Brevibacterium sp. H-BE7]
MSAKKRRNPGNRNDRTQRAETPAQSSPNQPSPEQPEPLDNERIPMPERPEPKKFNAPLWAGGIVVIAILAVLAFNIFGSKDQLTVDSLERPAVAALDGGSEVYPANSKLAFTENVKFGYLPAPTLTALSDGTIIAADPEGAKKAMGLDDDLASLDRSTFLDQTINPPRKDTSPGDPITWDQLVDDLGGDTVLMPAIDSAEVARPAVDTIIEAKAEEATIVRTEDPEVAKAAVQAGIAVMFTGDYTSTSAEDLQSQGYGMVAVAADDVSAWTDSGLKVWAIGVKDEKQLGQLAKEDVFGALSTNPYSIQPSDVKTD